jgi:chromosome segregation ATPase
MAVGCAFAAASLFGNVWFGRFGILVLAAASFVAVRSAWNEVIEARLDGHNQLLSAENRHQDLLFETRQSATIVREVLRKRNSVLSETLTATLTDLATTRTEVLQRNRLLAEQIRIMSSMRGDLVAARLERDELVGDVAALVNRVERLETNVRSESAEVLNLPRRVRRPGRSESWSTDELPSVAEMVQLDVKSPATPVWKQA